jgi:hypothetical protein
MSSHPSLPPAQLDTVIDRMQAQLDQWAETDARRVFLNCYLLMTRNMLAALEEGEFHDPVWVNRLLNRFADYYFDALHAYDGRLSHTPRVWRITFDIANTPTCHPLQHLMLGVNAHISYDLVLALTELLQAEWPHLSEEARRLRYQDHCHVNAVIGRTIDTVQDEVIAKLTPGFALLDNLLGPLDEWVTTRTITAWRETVWHYATTLLACQSDPTRAEVRGEVETLTLARAEYILLDPTHPPHFSP